MYADSEILSVISQNLKRSRDYKLISSVQDNV